MAAIISAYSSYVALSFLPPLAWLLFYLHEDRHPEPKQLLLLTFIAGIASAIAAVAAELAVFGRPPVFSGLLHRIAPSFLAVPVILFLGVAFIEECLKYAAVRFTVLRRPEFDEPIDAMIYMVTAALGFAAIENVLFLVPVFERGFSSGFELTTNRFLGANLLHALSSAIVGYALARHLFSPWRRHAVAGGIAAASVLHAIFNYLIITKDAVPEALTLLVFLLALMAVAVFADFERLKRIRATAQPLPPHATGQHSPRTMARSFFERLTGSIRINEEGMKPAGRSIPEPKPRRRAKEPEEKRVIHPVVSEESRAEQEPEEPEPGEEGQLTVDIYDDGPAIVIQSSVAGVKPEDVDISLQEDTLTIRGTRARHKEVDEANFYYKELYWGTFSRSIILPEEVEFQKADASIKNGLLTIRLPKKDRSEKKIKVKME